LFLFLLLLQLLHRQRVEQEYAPVLQGSHHIGLTIWSPLKFGFLSGKYLQQQEQEQHTGRLMIDKNTNYKGYVHERTAQYRDATITAENVVKLRNCMNIAEELNCTMPQLAIAWILKNENVSSVITGASRKEQVTENFSALKTMKLLTPEVMQRLDAITKN